MSADTKSKTRALREINRSLRERLERMTRECAQQRPAIYGDIAWLLLEVVRTGTSLRSDNIPAKGIDPEMDLELDSYRLNMLKLREMLPSIHLRLLAERTRIEAQQSRVRSATEWAGALRQTV